MSQTPRTVGIDIGKNSFHVVGQDEWRDGAATEVVTRSIGSTVYMPPCLVGTEACVGAHDRSRKLKALSHYSRLMPANSSVPNREVYFALQERTSST
jgi:transposase